MMLSTYLWVALIEFLFGAAPLITWYFRDWNQWDSYRDDIIADVPTANNVPDDHLLIIAVVSCAVSSLLWPVWMVFTLLWLCGFIYFDDES
jgi:hypothetical protein